MPVRLFCLLLIILSIKATTGLAHNDSSSQVHSSSEITTLEIKLALLEDKMSNRDKISTLERLIKIKEGEENYLEAIDYSSKLLNTYPVGEVEIRSEIVNRIGDYNNKIGDYYSAIGYYHTSLHLNTKIEAKETARMLYKIGVAYTNITDSIEAGKVFDKALTYIEPFEDTSLYVDLVIESGKIKRYQKKYKEAVKLFNNSLKLLNGKYDRERLGTIYYNLGALAYHERDYEKSLPLLRTAFNYFRESGDYNGTAKCYMVMAHIMKKYGKPLIAFDYYERAKDFAERGGNLRLLHNILNHAAKNQESQGNFMEAIGLFKSAHAIQDSIAYLKNHDEVQRMQARYNFNSKQQEIESLKNEAEIKALTINKNRISIVTILIAASLVLLITLFFFQRNKYLYNKKINIINQKLLRMQMNPHFIFNALSAIQSFVLDNDPREAGKYLSTFARLIRLVLENSKNEFVSIEKEKKLLVNYLELQQLRFNRKFEYNIFVDPNINTYEMMIPTMITQPFVENSIEHGIQGISEKGKINISFTLSKEHIVLVVEDNGVGLNGAAIIGEKMLDHQSLATLVTGERLKLLNQKSKVKYNLDYAEANLNGAENPGTKVTIKMPYKV